MRIFWRLHLPLLLLAAIPGGALLLVKMPNVDAETMSSPVAQDAYPGLKVKGARFDGSLMLLPPGGSGLTLASALEPGAVSTSLGLRVHIGVALRVYLARRQGERIYVQFSSSGPSRDGVFLEKAHEATVIQDARSLMEAAREAPYLRLVTTLQPRALAYQLNGRKAQARLPGGGWRPDLEVKALSDRSVLLLDDLAIWRLGPDGQASSLLRRSFGHPPVIRDLGLLLQKRLGQPRARVAAFAALMLAALLLDMLLLGLRRWTRLGSFTSLGRAGFLTLTWPTQVLVLMALRATARLPYAAVGGCLAVTLLVRYLVLIGHGLTDGKQRPAMVGRDLPALLVGLGLYAAAVALLARGSLLLALAPLLGALAAALLGRALPSRALLLFLAQAAGGLLLISFSGKLAVILYLGLTGISLLVGVTVHTLRGKVRGGLPVRILVVLGITATLIFCLEMGLRGVPGVFKHIEAEERQHLYNLVDNDHGDPLGRLKRAVMIKVGERLFDTRKAPETFRIVCLGSSSTNGIGAADPEAESYPAQLQAMLHARGLTNVQVIKAGVSGSTLSQLRIYLEEVLIYLKPDLVLLYYGANMDSLVARRYFLGLRQLLDRAPHVTTPEELWAATMLPTPSQRNIDLFLKLTRSRLFMAARSLIIIARGRKERTERADEPDELSVLIPETLQELAETCTRQLIPLLLIPEVLRTAILTPENPNAGGIRKRTWHYTEMFKAYALKHQADGVHFLSVHEKYTPAMVRRLFMDEMHQTAAGYEVLARSVADMLVASGLLPTPPP